VKTKVLQRKFCLIVTSSTTNNTATALGVNSGLSSVKPATAHMRESAVQLLSIMLWTTLDRVTFLKYGLSVKIF